MLKNAIKRSFIITLIALQVAFSSNAVFAVEHTHEDSAHNSSQHEAPATESNTGPSEPTGADGDTFVLNEETGLWENDYYTWDPVTKKTAPKGTPTYSYNPETKHWDTTEWRWDAAAGKYVPNLVETATPPVGAKIQGAENPSDSPALQTNSSSEGPNSPLSTNNNAYSNGQYDLFYNASISNKIKGIAQSGDASVINNTTGGGALTGNALSQATVLNMLQSVWDPSNGDIVTFNADIDGDVHGDLMIDPGQLPSEIDTTQANNQNLEINVSEDVGIYNEIDLAAESGDATVDHNSEAGDATTGTAAAVANVVNLINSVIGAGKSFVGTININGNLNGDILLPPEMLDQLLASNVPHAEISAESITNGNLLAEFNSKQTIENNIETDSSSGNANVSNNSSAGSAITGTATNNITVLNLTGREIIGSNAMLVFVNVLGKWVGMIMDAPGATSAALGGGVTSNKTLNANADIEADSTQTITNDIKLAAHSGDANVTNNTKAGNAKTGNASTSANVANVSNSKMSLGGWFGVLFINVFGNWLGSFGVNTSAGNQPTAAPATPTAPQTDVKVFRFVPSAGGAVELESVPTTGNLGTAAPAEAVATDVLGAATEEPAYGGTSFSAAPDTVKIYMGLAILGLIVMSAGKLIGFLKARHIA